MSALAQTLAMLTSVLAAFFWLAIPSLEQYSLQVFALCILLYFVLKKINQANIWEILPSTAVDEMTLTTFGFLILLGATAGTSSIFFPIIYIYLFFVSMTLEIEASIATTLGVILFFYLQNPSLNQQNLAHLLSLPLVMIFYLFAKFQYQQAKQQEEVAKQQQQLAQKEQQKANSYQVYLEEIHQELSLAKDNDYQHVNYFLQFFEKFLLVKLQQIEQLVLTGTQANQGAIRGQIMLIKLQVEKILQFFKN